MFKEPIKSRKETVDTIISYFDNVNIDFEEDITLKETDYTFGVKIETPYLIKYSPNSSVMAILHEGCHLLFCREYWNKEKHDTDLYLWAVEMLPNNGHPFVQMEELIISILGRCMFVKLDLILETIHYDSTTLENSGSYNEINPPLGKFKRREDEPLQYHLSLIPVANLLNDPTNLLVPMKCDIDFHPFYPFQKFHHGRYIEDYIKEPMTLDEFKTHFYNYDMNKIYGKKVGQLCGIIDDELNLIGRCNSEKVIENKEEFIELFRIPERSREQFISFFTDKIVK